mmetsp:Transcript_91817/g.259282  ORF Transcript_91817/g.259282 Transcript_91817/m.259282 type:complete len:218 (-) Transcript_91817:3106-3759(-)
MATTFADVSGGPTAPGAAAALLGASMAADTCRIGFSKSPSQPQKSVLASLQTSLPGSFPGSLPDNVGSLSLSAVTYSRRLLKRCASSLYSFNPTSDQTLASQSPTSRGRTDISLGVRICWGFACRQRPHPTPPQARQSLRSTFFNSRIERCRRFSAAWCKCKSRSDTKRDACQIPALRPRCVDVAPGGLSGSDVAAARRPTTQRLGGPSASQSTASS